MSQLQPYLQRAEARRARWQTRVSTWAPDPVDLDEPCIVGSYSLVAMETRRRYLVEPHLVSVGPYRESPGTVARDHLTLAYAGWRAERWSLTWPRRWELPRPWHPLYVIPSRFRDGVYLDVQRCWWTILTRYGWDCCYVPGRYLGYGRPPTEYPWREHKIARNALVSTAMPSVLREWRPRMGYRLLRRPNPWLQIPLLHLVSDVMHWLAIRAIEAGAIYVHTDGYIAPSPEVATRIRAAVESCGFQVKERARGAGWVRAVGDYRVGPWRSGVRAGEPTPLRELRHLEPREVRLLAAHLE